MLEKVVTNFSKDVIEKKIKSRDTVSNENADCNDVKYARFATNTGKWSCYNALNTKVVNACIDNDGKKVQCYGGKSSQGKNEIKYPCYKHVLWLKNFPPIKE